MKNKDKINGLVVKWGSQRSTAALGLITAFTVAFTVHGLKECELRAMAGQKESKYPINCSQ